MTRLVRMLVVASVMAVAVAVYAGVAVGHGGGNGNSGKQERHHGGKHRGNPRLRASLAPSQPTDPTFHGVAPGGAPWVLDRGSVKLKSKGTLDLRVRGLVLPGP